jgi:hypothetical protein
MGAVTDVVKRNVPASYRALVGVTNSYDYGIEELQALADFVQFKLFTTIPGSSNEASLWDANELELIGTLTTLQFIPAAIDFWGDALISEATTGTNENVTYLDRRPELWRVYERLALKAQELSAVVGVNITTIKTMLPKVSYGDNGRNILITPDPMDFQPPYTTSSVEDLVPWSYEQ